MAFYACGYTHSRGVSSGSLVIRKFPVCIAVDLTYMGGDVVDKDGNVLKESNILNWAFNEDMVDDWLSNNPPTKREFVDADIE
jgi:hypothetical protein